MNIVVDADTIAFAAAASSDDQELWVANARAKESVHRLMDQTKADTYELWLSGSENFRYKIYPEYKANRIKAYRPRWEKFVKEFMVAEMGAQVTDGIEADDMLGIRAGEDPSLLLVHIDKDLNQIPGKHYSWELTRLGKVVRAAEFYDISLEEANRYFYYQLLVGDTADNIKGVSGIGPVKAEALLSSHSPGEWYEVVREAYNLDEELELNAGCLYIWRKPNDSWRNLIDTSGS